MLTLIPLDEPAPVLTIPEHSSERFICQFQAGKFFWLYVGDKDRVLVTGSKHSDLWQAHRLLLAEIAVWASSGKTSQFGDEEAVRDCA